MYQAPMPWPLTGLALENSAMTDSLRMKQLESLQQKDAAFSAGYNRKCEEFGLNHEARKRTLDPWVSKMCEEFGCVIREELQEFARMLSKEYNYKFPAEFFDKPRRIVANDHSENSNQKMIDSNKPRLNFCNRRLLEKEAMESKLLKYSGEQKEEGVAEVENKNVESELREYSEEQKEDVAKLPIGADGLFVGKPPYEDIKGLDFLVLEQPEVTILSGHVERKTIIEQHSHLQVEIKSANDPFKIESTFPLPLSNFFQVRDLLRGKHLLLGSPISSSTHRFELEIIEANQVASIAALSQTMFGMDLANLRTKKKRPKRRKKERRMKQIEKVGIG